jgi:hypothetical protein
MSDQSGNMPEGGKIVTGNEANPPLVPTGRAMRVPGGYQAELASVPAPGIPRDTVLRSWAEEDSIQVSDPDVTNLAGKSQAETAKRILTLHDPKALEQPIKQGWDGAKDVIQVGDTIEIKPEHQKPGRFIVTKKDWFSGKEIYWVVDQWYRGDQLTKVEPSGQSDRPPMPKLLPGPTGSTSGDTLAREVRHEASIRTGDMVVFTASDAPSGQFMVQKIAALDFDGKNTNSVLLKEHGWYPVTLVRKVRDDSFDGIVTDVAGKVVQVIGNPDVAQLRADRARAVPTNGDLTGTPKPSLTIASSHEVGINASITHHYDVMVRVKDVPVAWILHGTDKVEFVQDPSKEQLMGAIYHLMRILQKTVTK